MKYGMRERISGVVIVVALAVIFVPMLFDEPDNADSRPDPVLTIEPPVEVEQHDVPAPEPPDGLGEIAQPQTHEQREESLAEAEEHARRVQSASDSETDALPEQGTAPAASEPESEPEREDPIAAIAQAADQRRSSSSSSAPAADSSGEWEVQVGSFGNPANAQGLVQQLQDKGFNAYTRPRGNSLTAVYAGPYASSQQAESARAQIKSSVNQNGMVKRVAP